MLGFFSGLLTHPDFLLHSVPTSPSVKEDNRSEQLTKRPTKRNTAEGTVRSYTLAALSVPQPCWSLGGTQVTEVRSLSPENQRQVTELRASFSSPG